MADRVHAALLGVYGRLPEAARLFLIRRATPSFFVGAMCVVERADGRLLLVRLSYRHDGWGFPGGLLARGEEPAAGARRELKEELGIDVDLVEPPTVVVDPAMRRVDVVFRARPAVGSAGTEDGSRSAEIAEVRWFEPDALPPLLPEAAVALAQIGRTLPRP